MKKRHVVGKEAEKLVAEELERMGYQVVARNFHGRWGEIDIIARKFKQWYVVEVKGTEDNADIYWRITPQKLRSLKRTWWHFANMHGIKKAPVFLFAFVSEVGGKPRVEFLQEEL
jgi:putative endonuclease